MLYSPSIEPASLWYQALEKPFFAPPSWVFGPVWSVLYILIIISFGSCFWYILQKKWPRKIALPFGTNIVSNLLFSPIQFTLQNNILALIDILIVLLSIIWIMKVTYPRERWIAYVQIPYLLWVSFATVLQASITYLNW